MLVLGDFYTTDRPGALNGHAADRSLQPAPAREVLGEAAMAASTAPS